MKLRVYALREHYTEPHRKALNDILKASWNSRTSEERHATYGKWVGEFEVVDSPDRADVHLLTMKWQHYVETGRTDEALRAVDVARRARRPLAVFSGGDFEANFPVVAPDVHVFQVAGYRSRGSQNHGMPAFIDDPLSRFGPLQIRDQAPRPVVGFCGQAGSSLPRHAARWIRLRARRLSWRFGRERYEPAPLEHTWFRQRVLDTFAGSREVEARFVLRTKYRAGVQTDDRNDPAERSRREFLENVSGTDYTVCVRGGGNFSVRFYEALAMGRIPAFVDTDCLLPFHDRIDWRRLAVWIDENEVDNAPAIVRDFHAKMSPSEFKERQLECRNIWEDRLTADGFYGHFREHFPV